MARAGWANIVKADDDDDGDDDEWVLRPGVSKTAEILVRVALASTVRADAEHEGLADDNVQYLCG